MSLLRRRIMFMRQEGQKIGVNLFTDWLDGKMLSSAGEDLPHPYFTSTDFVKLNAGYQYCVKVVQINYNNLHKLYFYDAEKTLISTAEFVLKSQNEQIIEIPDGARYARYYTYLDFKGYVEFYRVA